MNFALVRSWAGELESGVTKFERNKKTGALLVTDMPVFRSGTFRDSWGEQSTWESIHMHQMVSHFELLKNSGALPDVPVREGHFTGIKGLIGHHTSLRVEKMTSKVDGKEYDYLLASYEITEPEAQGKIERGTWRNRSSEIGQYNTNDEAAYWPVYMGFAYVDIPAVEGLNGFAKDAQTPGDGPILLTDKDTAVTTPQTPAPAEPTTPATPPAPPTPPAPAPTPTAHAAPAAPQAFSINGQNTTDYNAVQAHIVALEGFQKETREAARRAFVTSLIEGNKILASAKDDTEALVLSLNDEQFASYQKSFAAAPVIPQLGAVHGAPPPQGGAPSMVDAAADAIEVAKAQVKMHRASNMRPEHLKATASYQKLVAAGLEPA